MTQEDFELEAANFFLCEDGEELSVAKQYELLKEDEGNGFPPEGVIVWEPFSSYPKEDLLEQIERFAAILQKMYQAGKENENNL
jgi:hypothetical protein